MLTITPEDILLLARAEREAFVNSLQKIADGREEDEPHELPGVPADRGAG